MIPGAAPRPGWLPPTGIVLVLVLVLGASSPALAQLTDVAGCRWAVESAGERYTAGAFREALILLDPCLQQEELPRELRRDAHRLAILSHLRLNNQQGARSLLAELLAFEPDYAPDPVTDPPQYVAFFAAEAPVAAQVQPPAEPDVEAPRADPITETPIAVERLVRHWLVTGSLGAGSYGGERGEPRDGALDEFVANAGVSFAAGVAIPVLDDLYAGLRLQVHDLPSRFFYHWVGPEPIDLDASSSWSFGLLGEVTYLSPERWPLTLAGRFGLGGLFSYLNDQVRSGLIVQPGLDVGVPIDRDLSVVLAVDLGVVLPGTALDLRNESHLRPGTTRAYDLITQVGLGVRYRIAPLFGGR